MLYEACSAEQRGQEPYVVLWLHGHDGGAVIPTGNLRTMHRRLYHRTFFVVPVSPQPAPDGRRFFWGVSYTKAQNKNGLGFVFGELHTEYLGALSGLVRRVSRSVGASRVLVAGYSMGGFGAYQLGGHAPELFDAVVPVAGYGLGTDEPPDSSCGAPQPEAANVFSNFLSRHISRLASVPAVIVVHSPTDSVSSFSDARRMVETIREHGGNVELVMVPEEAADTDPSRKKKTKLGHHYFNYALLSDTSEEVLYSRLAAAFASIRRRNLFEMAEPASAKGNILGLARDIRSGSAVRDGQSELWPHEVDREGGKLRECAAAGTNPDLGDIHQSMEPAKARASMPWAYLPCPNPRRITYGQPAGLATQCPRLRATVRSPTIDSHNGCACPPPRPIAVGQHLQPLPPRAQMPACRGTSGGSGTSGDTWDPGRLAFAALRRWSGGGACRSTPYARFPKVVAIAPRGSASLQSGWGVQSRAGSSVLRMPRATRASAACPPWAP